MPRILAIESSCDETAAAVVEDGERVLSSVVASQLDTHGKYGGVVPELASREHLRSIVPVVRRAIGLAGSSLSSLDAIAVTEGPGLIGSLLVGITYAKALCFASSLPLVAVNGLRVAYIVTGNLYVQNSGGQPMQLTNSGVDSTPIFSDDGQKIVFFSWEKL